jgi:hypothetical protein
MHVRLSSLSRAAAGDYVVNHFKIAKKRVKKLLLYDAPDFRKSLFSEGLEASLVWSSVQSSFENGSAYGVLVE